MSGMTYSSQVPSAVIRKVLTEAWLSPLTTADRITLMTSSTLVNKQWAAMFNVISLRDIYVPTTSYFVQRLHPILDGQAKAQPDLRATCRSINISLEYATISPVAAFPNFALTLSTAVSIPGCADEPLMGHTLRALLSTLSERDCELPNLRTISIEFVNIGLDDVFVNDRFFRFPSQVTDLAFTFTYSPLVPPSHVGAVRANQAQHDFSRPTGLSARMDQSFRRGEILPCFRSVRRLCILGGSEATIADAVSQCPELELLEVDISGKPHPSLISTHLISLCALDAPLQGTPTALAAMPALAVKSGPCDMTPGVWYGVHVDVASGVSRFRRLAPIVVQRRRSRFMSRATKPFSRLFSSSLSKRKGNSSH